MLDYNTASRRQIDYWANRHDAFTDWFIDLMQFWIYKCTLIVWTVWRLSFVALNKVVSDSTASRVNLLSVVVQLWYHVCKVERLDVLKRWSTVVLIVLNRPSEYQHMYHCFNKTRAEMLSQNSLVVLKSIQFWQAGQNLQTQLISS